MAQHPVVEDSAPYHALIVQARLPTRKYIDKDNIERYATDIIDENM